MNSDIKPDFEKLVEAHYWPRVSNAQSLGFTDGCDKIWTNHVEPLLSTVKRLQEENERYKKALMAVRDFDDDNMDYDDPGSIAIEALKSSELNKEEHGE